MLDLNNKSILITGGTGSFGKEFVKTILGKYPDVKRLVIYSRDELKQYELAQTYSTKKYKALRYFIGDVRDEDRMVEACKGIDYIIHTAAMKQVPTAEYNPFECIKTNIHGAQNIVQAAIKQNVKKVVALSTDKAAGPINLYGATKLCSDKLFVSANNMKGDRDLGFSVVRYGNVMGSRGSVIPFFMKVRENGELPITDPNMTRFNISLTEGVNLVLFALEKSIGGEIFIPKIPSYRITDVATAVAPECTQKIVGIRPGEKMHEEMVTRADALNTLELENHYIICPSNLEYINRTLKDYAQHYGATTLEEGFSYNSETNPEWLTVPQIRELIRQNVDANFDINLKVEAA